MKATIKTRKKRGWGEGKRGNKLQKDKKTKKKKKKKRKKERKKERKSKQATAFKKEQKKKLNLVTTMSP